MNPIKTAILSCNHGHAKEYYQLKDNSLYKLVAVSLEPGYRDKIFLERLDGIPKYNSDEQMLDEHPEIEAVVIGSANSKHLQQFRLCAKRKLHVFSMKVPSFDMEEYDEMIRLADEAGIVCQVELEMRYHSEIERIKEIIESGRLGKILSITAINTSHNPMWWRPWQCIPEESYGRLVSLKPGDARYRGGALSDHPHIFDIIRYILNTDYESVYSEVSPNIRPDTEIEDMITVIGRMRNGVTFSLDPSYANIENRCIRMEPGWIKYPKCVEVNMTVHGEKGSIIADVYGNTVCYNGLPNENYIVEIIGRHIGGRHLIMDEFYDCVRNGKTPSVNLKSHRRTIEVMNACYESVSSGKVVRL